MYRHIFVIVCLFVTAAFGYRPNYDDCTDQAADIIFLLDSSSSIWVEDYKRLLAFVENLVDSFDIGIGDNLVRVGVITFSDRAHLDIPLDRYSDFEKLKNAIKKIPYRTGITNTAAALNMLRREISPKVDVRDGPVVAIVITDGLSRDTSATRDEAKRLHALGVNVYAVGVGDRYEMDELKAISSDPIKGVYQVASYSALEEIAHHFHIKPCRVRPEIPSTTKASPTTTRRQPTVPPTTRPRPRPTAARTTRPRPTRPRTTRPRPTTPRPTTPRPTTPRAVIPTRPRPSWTYPRRHRPFQIAPSVITFGFDLLTMGAYRTNMIYKFIDYLLPFSGYGRFGVISHAYCPEDLNIPISRVPQDLRGGKRADLSGTAPSVSLGIGRRSAPDLVDVVQRMRHDLQATAHRDAMSGYRARRVAVIFLDPEVTAVTGEFMAEVERMVQQGNELFVINIGQNVWTHPEFLSVMSSDSIGSNIITVPSYKDLVFRVQHSPFQFRALCDGYMSNLNG